MITFDTKVGEVGEWLGTGSLNFFGRPFAGKDTQAENFSDQYNGHVIGGGDIFRNSVVPPEVQAKIDAGEIAPTEDFVKIVMPYLSSDKFDSHPLMLSTVGRSTGEEVGVMDALGRANHPLLAVPLLSISPDLVIRRMRSISRERDDDGIDKITTRLDEFDLKTIPVLDAYAKLDLIVEIDASRDQETVFRGLVHALHEFATS